MRHKGIPLMISKCVEREVKQSYLIERFQALKLIAYWVETSPQTVPRLFFQSLVAIAGHVPDDQMKKPAIEILRKGSIFCTSLCAWSGGLSILIGSVIDPACADISESIVLTLLYLINDPRTRAYLRAYIDINRLFAIFTENRGNERDLKKESLARLETQLELGKRAIVTLMKNWSGLIYITADSNGLRSLVQALNQPTMVVVKKAIFSIFFDIFNINMSYDEDRTKGSLKSMNSDNLLNTYMIMIIEAFNLCGIYDVLIKIATSAESELTESAQQLLKKFMQLSSILLPAEPNLLSLIEMASDFKSSDPSLRFRASKTLRELGECYKNATIITPEFKKNMSNYFLRSVEFIIGTPQGVPYTTQLKSIWGPLRAELDYDLDPSQFTGLLKSTNVAAFKNDESKWNWKLLLELFENNLKKPIRMKEALNMVFIKPLMKFFQPGKDRFVDKPWTPENFLYAKVGYYMVKSLLLTKQGRMALAVPQSGDLFSKKSFLSYYSEQLILESVCMKALKENITLPDADRWFRKDRLISTMSREYLSWLGLFTQSKAGIELLRSGDIFSHLKKLADPSGTCDSLCTIIINSFDYRSDDEPRNLLQLWINKGSKDLILYIIEHLRILYRSGLNTFSTWCVDILVSEIYDKDLEIALKALDVIKEVYENEEVMYAILSKWPQVDRLELGGDDFIARFLRTEGGIKFFKEFDWINGAIKRWLEKVDLDYVEVIEKNIYNELNIKNTINKDDNLQLHIPIDCPLDIRSDVILLINLDKSISKTPVQYNLDCKNLFW